MQSDGDTRREKGHSCYENAKRHTGSRIKRSLLPLRLLSDQRPLMTKGHASRENAKRRRRPKKKSSLIDMPKEKKFTPMCEVCLLHNKKTGQSRFFYCAIVIVLFDCSIRLFYSIVLFACSIRLFYSIALFYCAVLLCWVIVLIERCSLNETAPSFRMPISTITFEKSRGDSPSKENQWGKSPERITGKNHRGESEWRVRCLR